jgi:GMC oxidoreductase/FAD dependent oxidoreductase
LIVSAEDIDLSRLSPEIIIVGGGAVGLLAAVYLASQNVKVLVLEAGPAQLDPTSQAIFEAAVSSGRKHLGIYQGRFRALGGTTNFWGGQLVRFDRLVFTPRPWVSNGGWPLEIDDIEPFYKECEALLDVPHELNEDEKVIAAVHPPEECRDDNLCYFFTRWLTEKNFRFRFARFFASNEYATVVTNAPVTSLRLGPDLRNVSAVVVRGPRGIVEVGARYVALANGTIELVRLLQHRTAGGEVAPWSHNRWLGCGFMDHLEGTVATITPINQKLFRALFDNVFIKGMKLQPRLKLSEALQFRDKLLGAALHVKFDTELEEHVQSAKIFISGLLKGRFSDPAKIVPELWAAMRVGFPMAWHYVVNQRIWSPAGGNIQIRIMLEHAPLVSSTINLTEKRDENGMQLPELKWTISTEQEIKTIQTAATLAKKYFESRNIARVAIPEEVVAGRPNLLESFVDTFHHMGGARMARSELDGFVDPTSRVFGSENLYLMGAAIFPVSGFANPTFTAMALGLRAAETIKQRLVVR